MSKYPLILSLYLLISGLAHAEEGKHLFVLSGQSNMAGLDPQASFTPTVEKKFGRENVIVVKSALGAQPIRRWVKNWKPEGTQNPTQIGDLYATLLEAVNKAVDGQPLKSVTFLWMQGETDAFENLSERYEAAFKHILAQLKADFHRENINFVIGRLSDAGLNAPSKTAWVKIREIQVALAEGDARGAWVDTDDLNDGKNPDGREFRDDIHYTADGYVIFGRRLADKAIALIEK